MRQVFNRAMESASREDFELEVRPHVDALYRTALRMTGRVPAAEDLVQDTYVKAFRNYHRFQQGTNFKAWIFTILTHAFINDHRRRVRAPKVTDFTQVEPAADEVVETVLSAADVEAIGEKLGDEARRALDKVPLELRLVFLMSTFEDLSYKEIAAALDVPIGTIMSRLFRARAILRAELVEFAQNKGFVKGRTPA